MGEDLLPDIVDKFYRILHPIRERLEKKKIVKVPSKDLMKSGDTFHKLKSRDSLHLRGKSQRRIWLIREGGCIRTQMPFKFNYKIS